jgi:hypothetical protein
MAPIRSPAGGISLVDDGGGDLAAAALFAIVWEALAEMLGTAAVAAIVRRAAGRAATESPELVEVVIFREDHEYRYTLPRTWSQGAERGLLALRVLVAEIGHLLLELTGIVVIRRMEQIPELRARGLVWRVEEAN